MSQINSGNKRNPVAFVNKDCRSSISISITDYVADASWRLRVEVEVEDGGRFCLGAVDTVQPRFRVIRNPNCAVAVCSVPNVRNWYVYPELLTGTPTPGHSEIFAEVKFSSAPEYAGGCCPLVAVPGHSTNVNEVGDQSPDGGPVVGPRVTLFTGPGYALAADIAYLGAGIAPVFLQQHDAGASDPVSTSTMISVGLLMNTTTFQTRLLSWERRRRFDNGFTFAMSTSQTAFIAAADTIAAFGQWDIS